MSSRHHKVRMPDGPRYLWFPRRWKFFWSRLAGSCGKRLIRLNPYILDEKSGEYAVYVITHEYLHWWLFREFDTKTARRLDRLGRPDRHHHHEGLFFARLRMCIWENNLPVKIAGGGVGGSQSGDVAGPATSGCLDEAEGKGRVGPAPSAAAPKRILRRKQ